MRDEAFMEDRGLRPEPSLGSRITSSLAALALVLAGLSIGLTVTLHYSPDLIDRVTAAVRPQEVPRPKTAVAPVPSPAPVAEATTAAPAAPPAPQVVAAHVAPVASTEQSPEVISASEPAPLLPLEAESSASTQTETLLVREPDESAAAEETVEPATQETAPAPKAQRVARTIAKASQPQPAKLIVAVSPRGELYIDDEHRGTTPPLQTLDLEPGMHRIEIRSGSRKPFVTYVTVQAGDERRIRHDFSAKPVRVPR